MTLALPWNRSMDRVIVSTVRWKSRMGGTPRYGLSGFWQSGPSRRGW